MPSPTLAILGTGLIGGSLALALRARRAAWHLVGYDRTDVAAEALARGAVHAVAASPAEAVAGADVVVLATPPAAALRLLSEIAPHLGPGTLVTDVGSVKRPVMAHARAVLPAGVRFVGGHPMAGRAQGGIAHANPLLFENAVWVLCPETAPDAPEAGAPALPPLLLALVEAVGARAVVLDAARHDRIAAAVSHLPQLLAVVLAGLAGDADPQARTLAAGGFRDMTRIASSPFGLWREIMAANHGPLLDALAAFARRFERLRHAIAAEDWAAAEAAFDAARALRETIPERSKGFLHPLAELTVRAEDRPGFLAALFAVLAEAGLNVRDVELLTVREAVEGAFRIGFEDEAALARALGVLRAAGYDAVRLA
ncbi:MAG: prephenate dehydrogenase/arogenate dehydrogenase family protein [Rubricoccaceae bacterium]